MLELKNPQASDMVTLKGDQDHQMNPEQDNTAD